MIALFEAEHNLSLAARAVRHAGCTQVEAYAPHPIDGLAQELHGPEQTVPFVAFTGGCTGAIGAFAMQVIAYVWDYPMNVGGRPNFSWPSFIPISFEGTILLAGVCATAAVLLLSGLPRLDHPCFNATFIERASQDAYALMISSDDPVYDAEKLRNLLSEAGAEQIEEVDE